MPFPGSHKDIKLDKFPFHGNILIYFTRASVDMFKDVGDASNRARVTVCLIATVLHSCLTPNLIVHVVTIGTYISHLDPLTKHRNKCSSVRKDPLRHDIPHDYASNRIP